MNADIFKNLRDKILLSLKDLIYNWRDLIAAEQMALKVP